MPRMRQFRPRQVQCDQAHLRIPRQPCAAPDGAWPSRGDRPPRQAHGRRDRACHARRRRDARMVRGDQVSITDHEKAGLRVRLLVVSYVCMVLCLRNLGQPKAPICPFLRRGRCYAGEMRGTQTNERESMGHISHLRHIYGAHLPHILGWQGRKLAWQRLQT